jgi:hypothetical protein
VANGNVATPILSSGGLPDTFGTMIVEVNHVILYLTSRRTPEGLVKCYTSNAKSHILHAKAPIPRQCERQCLPVVQPFAMPQMPITNCLTP